MSRLALLCLPYSYRNISVQIKKLVDNDWLQRYDKGKRIRYRLLSKATDYLLEKDELRFMGYGGVGEQIRTDIRSMTLGDTTVLFRLAGYGVGQDDKPSLPAHTPNKPDESKNRLPFYQNYYYDYGYLRYETPINCFYSSTEIKRFAEKRADSGTNDVQYSRITGILHTPDRYYRTYHTRDVAMDFRPTGEENVKALISELFSGYHPDNTLGTLVFGYNFEAAKKILEQGLDQNRLKMARLHGGNQLRLNGSNLSHHLLYFPIRKEIIAPLRFMRFPSWEEWLGSYITENLFPTMSQDGAGFFLGEVDNYNLFNGLYMNLTHFSVILNNLHNSNHQNIAILCFEWQRELYETMLSRYTIPENSFEVYELSSADFEQIVRMYETYWQR